MFVPIPTTHFRHESVCHKFERFLAFRVLIFTIWVSFTQRMSYLQALVPVYSVRKFWLLPMLTHFHIWSFWVPILTAGGPYFTKNGSFVKAWGSLLVLEAVQPLLLASSKVWRGTRKEERLKYHGPNKWGTNSLGRCWRLLAHLTRKL